MTGQFNNQIYAEASDWLVEFRSGDPDAATRAAFYRWLRMSPEHMRAYLELAAIWNEGAALDASRVYDDERLINEYRREISVVSIVAPANQSISKSPLPARRALLTMAASVVCAVALGFYWYLVTRNTFATTIGEQRTVILEDGSTVELNSGSQIRVRFIREQRDVDLLQGQALFHVAKNAARPFVVHSGTTDVRAVGTQFDVYKQGAGQTTVTVVEGRVAVLYAPGEVGLPNAEGDAAVPSSQGQPNPAVQQDLPNSRDRGGAVLLGAGQQITITNGAAKESAQTDVSAATAWTRHQLVFKGTPLRLVAEEFNRYNSRRLVVDGPELGALKITGIFSSTDSAPLVSFLESRSEVRLVQTEREIHVSSNP